MIYISRLHNAPSSIAQLEVSLLEKHYINSNSIPAPFKFDRFFNLGVSFPVTDHVRIDEMFITEHYKSEITSSLPVSKTDCKWISVKLLIHQQSKLPYCPVSFTPMNYT